MNTKNPSEAKANPIVLALTVEEAAHSLSIGRTMCYRMISEGRLRIVKVGSRSVVPVKAIEEFLGSAA
jgi:excisionase family DNA binding protein